MDNKSIQTNSSINPASNRSFPINGTPIANIIDDVSKRNAFHRNIQLINRYVVALYRSGLLPLFGAGKKTMLLITKGRKSKKLRCFPVGYVRVGGEIYLISGWGKDSNWYKNIVANPKDVRLQIGFRRFAVQAKFIEESGEIRRIIEKLIIESPLDAHRLFGWDPTSDRIENSDFSRIINKVLFVKFIESKKY
jgi:deazaflavin-dependent oxidoreductase (nitroreductase family)